MAKKQEEGGKQKVFVSFSGGETSAFMCHWLLNNKADEYEMKFIFANTGEENEETLIFADRCDKQFGLNLTWVQFDMVNGKPKFKVVDFETAYRSNRDKVNDYKDHPFLTMIDRQGIPNKQNMICTRELKEYPMKRYFKSIGWKPRNFKIAIGIRADEIDRVGKHYYPLVKLGITKPMVNAFWSKMSFRLELKGYQGNCKTCWKKSFRKLGTIAQENPEHYDFFKFAEAKYENFTPPTRNIVGPHRFFRSAKTVDEILQIPNDPKFEKASDDSQNTNYKQVSLEDGTELDASNGCIESCEVF